MSQVVKNKNSNIRNILNIIVYLLIIIGIIIMSFKIFSPHRYNKIVRYVPYVVISDSMEPTIKSDSLIVVDKRAHDNLIIDDIITFKYDLDGDGIKEVITHRVAEIESNHPKTYRTRPDSIDTLDPWVIPHSDVIGEVVFHVPYLGILILVLNENIFPILIISNLIILILIIQTIRKWEKL